MIIDLGQIDSVQELHLKFKTDLGFPDFYGMNWDAFWDAITGLTDMPDELTLINWKAFEQNLPSDSEILRDLIMDFNRTSSTSEIAIEQVY